MMLLDVVPLASLDYSTIAVDSLRNGGKNLWHLILVLKNAKFIRCQIALVRDAVIIIAVMSLITSCIKPMKNNMEMELLVTALLISIKTGIKNSMNGGTKWIIKMIILVMNQELALIGEDIYSYV